MTKGILFVCFVVLLSFTSPEYATSQSDKADQPEITMCHLPNKGPDASVTVVETQFRGWSPLFGQDYDQPNSAPHRYSPGDGCSSKNSKAKPKTELNGVKANTVGCKCVKTCEKGQVKEDLRKEKGVYICSNACHKDRCFCPNPCKS